MYKHILIPTDGSALSNEALIRSLQLAKTFGAAVTILTVEEPFHVFSMGSAQLAASLNDYQDQIRSQAERLLNEAAAQAASWACPARPCGFRTKTRIRPSSTPPPSAAAT